MSLILSGTDGLSDVDGSAATPAIRGTDANTGIFFPAADTIAFAEGGVEAMRIDSSGQVGIGTVSPSSLLHVSSSAATNWQVRVSGTSAGNFSAARFYNDAGNALDVGISGSTASYGASLGMIGTATNNPLTFKTNDTERMRIDSNGGVRINNTSNATFSAQLNTQFTSAFQCGQYLKVTNTSASQSMFIFGNTNNDAVGSIATSGSGTSYNTSSDYRLKQDIAPMTGALAKVALLKPCTYKWIVDGSDGEGFIAHELAEVCPNAVNGEKDAVNEDGSIKPQGIDTSFLVATLTAAIQEQQALITALTARITALENK